MHRPVGGFLVKNPCTKARLLERPEKRRVSASKKTINSTEDIGATAFCLKIDQG